MQICKFLRHLVYDFIYELIIFFYIHFCLFNINILNKLARTGDNALPEKDLRNIEKDQKAKAAQYNNLREHAKQMALEAKDKLNRLEKMTEKGHKDTQSFTDMKNALKKVSEIDADNMSLYEINSRITDLKSTSNAYKTSHDRIIRRRWGYGNDRFKMSKELESFANQNIKTLDEKAKGISKVDAKQNMKDRAEFHTSLANTAKEVREARNPALNISANDLANKIGVDQKDHGVLGRDIHKQQGQKVNEMG